MREREWMEINKRRKRNGVSSRESDPRGGQLKTQRGRKTETERQRNRSTFVVSAG